MISFLNIVIFLLFAKLAAELWLGALNRKKILDNKDAIPEPFKDVVTQATYDKTVDYSLAKSSFSKWDSVYDAAILAIFLFSGILPVLFDALQDAFGVTLWAQSFTLVTLGMILSIPQIPVDWYQQFRLEEEFGFNRSTLKLWITDKVKGIFLAFIIGAPIAWVLLKFFYTFESSWWIWAFAFIVVFQILMMILYPKLIMPLFSKLEPLKDEILRERLMKLADRTGFKAQTIEVMDGSKRSGHSNAFFTGFGRFRRIVLFDTLVDQLTHEELEAVLAHEIGHYKKGHIPQMLLISTVSTFISFALMGWLVKANWFYQSFGFEVSEGIVPALILFMLLAPLFTFWITPFMNAFSRKNEYEADAFAKDAMGGPDHLISSLRKLTKENLGNLTPHPAFSRFYYSHPTLLERETALRQ